MASFGDSINCDKGFIKQLMFNSPIWGGNNKSNHDTFIKSRKSLINVFEFRYLRQGGGSHYTN